MTYTRALITPSGLELEVLRPTARAHSRGEYMAAMTIVFNHDINRSQQERLYNHLDENYTRQADSIFPLIGEPTGDVQTLCIYGRLKQPIHTALVLAKLYRALTELYVQTRDAEFASPHIGIACSNQKGGDDQRSFVRKSIAAAEYARETGRAFIVSDEEHFSNDPKSITFGAGVGLYLIADLGNGSAGRSVIPYYQPIFDLRKERVVGNEALARLIMDGKVVSPALFIYLAERLGLVGEVSRRMIEQGCEQTKRWQDSDRRLDVAFNLSPYEIREKRFLETLRRATREYELSPEEITVELTEGVCDRVEEGEVINYITKVQQSGYPIALDDAFTGNNGLSRFMSLPWTELKLDRHLLVQIDPIRVNRGERDRALTTANSLVVATRRLPGHHYVVAEGVERDVLPFVQRRIGANAVQAYCISPPLPAEAYEQFMAEHSRWFPRERS